MTSPLFGLPFTCGRTLPTVWKCRPNDLHRSPLSLWVFSLGLLLLLHIILFKEQIIQLDTWPAPDPSGGIHLTFFSVSITKIVVSRCSKHVTPFKMPAPPLPTCLERFKDLYPRPSIEYRSKLTSILQDFGWINRWHSNNLLRNSRKCCTCLRNGTFHVFLVGRICSLRDSFGRGMQFFKC